MMSPPYFSFIRTGDIKRLAGFCMLRKDRPWIAVVVASYLRRDMARALLGSLPTEIQRRVALQVLTLPPVPQERVEALESDVKAFLGSY
jgi:flagellar motor switch protein FliG